jgi:radical SAM superfamily enzyme YgiQ (UPF0313 family)
MNNVLEHEGMHYEGNCIRPPSEGDSILLQVTLGCSHNKCTFCGAYKDKRFWVKDNYIILRDILFASKYMRGSNRVFLMDGDALIIPQKRLTWILDCIKEHLPWVTDVASYANTKSIAKKSPEDLKALHVKGLNKVYLGVETGDDEVRKKINKGSTAQQCLEMARKIKDAGIQLTITVLLGIAGEEGSLRHARLTGELISAIDPDYVSPLTLMLVPGTPLYDMHKRSDFTMPDERGMLMEMKEMLTHINVRHTLFSSYHASNYLPIRVWLPEGKQQTLDMIDAALREEVRLRPEWARAF